MTHLLGVRDGQVYDKKHIICTKCGCIHIEHSHFASSTSVICLGILNDI